MRTLKKSKLSFCLREGNGMSGIASIIPQVEYRGFSLSEFFERNRDQWECLKTLADGINSLRSWDNVRM